MTAQDAHVATVAGEDVYFCADTSVDARVFTVTAGSRLTNDGVLEAADGILVDGTLDGSGRFGGTVVREGGELSLGGTSDAPTFESLAVEDGARLVFHVDEGTSGSGCQLRVEDGLALADGADVTILLTPGYVVSDAIGKNTTWNLVETGAEAGDGLAASMQACTSFRVAWEDGEATLDQLGMQVRRSSWTQDGGSLVLNATLGYVHNGVLTWDNDAGNRAWNTVSGNWLDEEGYGDIFVYGYTCRFTDVGAGAVTLVGDLDPDAVEVDAAADYVFGGAGRIINGSLVKKGEGSLTINTANTYAGGTVIEGGTVVVGDADALGTGVVQIKGGDLVLDGKAVSNELDIAAGGTGRILLGGSSIEGTDDKDGHITGATVSHTSADGTETTGIRGTEQAHAVVDNVRIDLAAGSTLVLENADIGCGVRITDDPATVLFRNTRLDIVAGGNATLTSITVEGATLRDSVTGDELTLTGTQVLLEITSDALTSVTIDGTALTLNFAGFDLADADLVRLVFGEGDLVASFAEGTQLAVTGVFGEDSYTGMWKDGDANGVYFSVKSKGSPNVPEPATGALTLLALAALASRRRRRRKAPCSYRMACDGRSGNIHG